MPPSVAHHAIGENAQLLARIAELEGRGVQGGEREAFEAYAKVKLGASFTDGELAELVHLMMSTPHYQLS